MSGRKAWRDTTERYGRVSRLLHWAVAWLVLWQFVTLIGWRLLGDGPVMRTVSAMGPYHGTTGVLVLCLLGPRLAWTLASRRRRRPVSPSWRDRLAAAVHGLFYMLLFLVPALALLRAYGSGKGFALWGRQLVPATGHEVPWLTAPADTLHGPLAWVLAALVAGHAVMALMPHGDGRSRAIMRMAGPARAPAAPAPSPVSSATSTTKG